MAEHRTPQLRDAVVVDGAKYRIDSLATSAAGGIALLKKHFGGDRSSAFIDQLRWDAAAGVWRVEAAGRATTPAHPEAACERCGRPNAGSWHAPSPLWNAVLRDPSGSDAWDVLCPQCFAELADSVLGPQVWCLRPHDLDVAPLWSDADGRLWDSERCLWVAPSTAQADLASTATTPSEELVPLDPGSAERRLGWPYADCPYTGRHWHGSPIPNAGPFNGPHGALRTPSAVERDAS